MRVTLELSDVEVNTAIAEYMQRRYPNANRYGMQRFRWLPKRKRWVPIRQPIMVRWETHVG